MHVESTALGDRKQIGFQHVPVIKRKQKIGRERAQPLAEIFRIRVRWINRLDTMATGELGDAFKPDVLTRRINMGDDQWHVDAVREQGRQASIADIVVPEDDSA